MRSTYRILIATLGSVALTASGVATVAAQSSPTKAVTHDTWSFGGTNAVNDCEGTPLVQQFTVDVQASSRPVDGQVFLGTFHLDQHAVFTNPNTGGFFAIDGHWLSKDVSATLLTGTTYAIKINLVGQGFQVKDASGKVILRDAGLTEYLSIRDELGDGTPEAEEIYSELVRTVGRNASGTLDFCALAAQLTALP